MIGRTGRRTARIGHRSGDDGQAPDREATPGRTWSRPSTRGEDTPWEEHLCRPIESTTYRQSTIIRRSLGRPLHRIVRREYQPSRSARPPGATARRTPARLAVGGDGRVRDRRRRPSARVVLRSAHRGTGNGLNGGEIRRRSALLGRRSRLSARPDPSSSRASSVRSFAPPDPRGDVVVGRSPEGGNRRSFGSERRRSRIVVCVDFLNVSPFPPLAPSEARTPRCRPPPKRPAAEPPPMAVGPRDGRRAPHAVPAHDRAAWPAADSAIGAFRDGGRGPSASESGIGGPRISVRPPSRITGPSPIRISDTRPFESHLGSLARAGPSPVCDPFVGSAYRSFAADRSRTAVRRTRFAVRRRGSSVVEWSTGGAPRPVATTPPGLPALPRLAEDRPGDRRDATAPSSTRRRSDRPRRAETLGIYPVDLCVYLRPPPPWAEK